MACIGYIEMVTEHDINLKLLEATNEAMREDKTIGKAIARKLMKKLSNEELRFFLKSNGLDFDEIVAECKAEDSQDK